MLYGAIDRRKSPIEPALRSLVTVRVSQLNGCAFCVDLNSATLLKRGVSAEKALALGNWRDSDLFTLREQTVLTYAEAMTLSEVGVNDAQFEALRREFSDDAIIELTGLIAFQNLSSKFNAALDVPPQGFCELPAAAPKYGTEVDASDSAEPESADHLISFPRKGAGNEPR
jgi:AhpD family alkylhydroperoxidase